MTTVDIHAIAERIIREAVTDIELLRITDALDGLIPEPKFGELREEIDDLISRARLDISFATPITSEGDPS